MRVSRLLAPMGPLPLVALLLQVTSGSQLASSRGRAALQQQLQPDTDGHGAPPAVAGAGEHKVTSRGITALGAVLAKAEEFGAIKGGQRMQRLRMMRSEKTATAKEAAVGDMVMFENLEGVVAFAGAGTLQMLVWGAGAVSQGSITGLSDARKGVKFQPLLANKALMVGLKHSPSSVHSFEALDFAACACQGDRFRVFEQGTFRGRFGNWTPGDTIEVAINHQGLVEYRVNGDVRYTSDARPSFPLFVGASFRTPGGRVHNVQWAAVGDMVVFENLEGVVAFDGAGSLKKLYWGAGAVSQGSIAGPSDAKKGVKFQPLITNKALMVGLKHGLGAVHSFIALDFAACTFYQNRFWVFEQGTFRGHFGSYAPGDTIEVAINHQGLVEYRVNGDVRYTSGTSPSFPLFVGASFFTPGGKVHNVRWAGA